MAKKKNSKTPAIGLPKVKAHKKNAAQLRIAQNKARAKNAERPYMV